MVSNWLKINNSIFVGDTLRYIVEGHNGMVKLVKIICAGSGFPEFEVEHGNKDTLTTTEKFLRNVDKPDIASIPKSGEVLKEPFKSVPGEDLDAFLSVHCAHSNKRSIYELA